MSAKSVSATGMPAATKTSDRGLDAPVLCIPNYYGVLWLTKPWQGHDSTQLLMMSGQVRFMMTGHTAHAFKNSERPLEYISCCAAKVHSVVNSKIYQFSLSGIQCCTGTSDWSSKFMCRSGVVCVDILDSNADVGKRLLSGCSKPDGAACQLCWTS
jgi:hypothetical protein